MERFEFYLALLERELYPWKYKKKIMCERIALKSNVRKGP